MMFRMNIPSSIPKMAKYMGSIVAENSSYLGIKDSLAVTLLQLQRSSRGSK